MIHIKQLTQLALASLFALGAASAQAGIVNGGFEIGAAGSAATGWTDTDSSFGTMRCNVATCGTGGIPTTAAPASGDFWIWFGGGFDAQVGKLTQSAVLDIGSTTLLFDFWTGLTGGVDATLTLSIDSNVVWTVTQATAAAYSAGYSTVSINLAGLADGGSHLLSWDFIDAADANNSGTTTNWSLDNVRLGSANAVPEPGSLALVGLAGLALAATRRRNAR